MASGRGRRFGIGVASFVGFIGVSVVTGLLLSVAIAPGVSIAGTAADHTVATFNNLPDFLRIESLPQTSTIYANAGTAGSQQVPIAKFYAQNRVEVPNTAIATTVKQAAVAAEDPRFYREGGIDVTGTLRGAIRTYLFHGSVQGGSSITQQYVKNVLVQKCTKYDTISDNAAEQAAQQKKFQACYKTATVDTPVRKIHEMRYAIGVSKRYSKADILNRYLNISGFGGLIYGIESASQYYYGIPASQDDVNQAATLVSIINNPNYLRIDGQSVSPDKTATPNTAQNGFAATLARRNYVLRAMHKAGYLDANALEIDLKAPITPKITPTQTGCMAANAENAGAFCDLVTRILENSTVFGKTQADRDKLINDGGLQIHTTLNLQMQQVAQQAVSAYVPPTFPNVDLGGSNVAVEVGSGRIVDMVQNQSYNNSNTPTPGTTAVNYNENNKWGSSQGFQTGSSFKAFDLIEWLREGHSLNDVINTTQHVFPQTEFHESAPCDNIGGKPYNVKNDDPAAPSMSVFTATAQSVNTAFVQMGTKLDLCAIKADAYDLLIRPANPAPIAQGGNPFLATPSSLLGINYIAPIAMATAYAGLANNGVACSSIAIDSITDSAGKAVPVPKTHCSTTPIDPAIAAGVVDALHGPLTSGTATIANPHDGVPIFGKTGTTDSSYENWFVSSTTKVAQASWVGNLQGVPHYAGGPAVQTSIRSLTLGGQYGGDAKLHIAHAVIVALDKIYGGGAFPNPPASALTAPPPPPTTAPSAPDGGGTSGNGGTSGDGGTGDAGGTGANPPTPAN